MGERVDGYELLEPLGQGGMGVVYRARELETGREVALKRISADEIDEDLWLRFEREALALAQVSHPNVLTVHRAGRSPKGPYLVTELVEGEDLDARIERAGALPPAEVVRLVRPLASAVAALHDAGMVHRDIKPANVIVRPSGEPVLLDFGLVQVEGSSLTATGDLMGSPAYMSPEQATGARSAVGPSSDVYALGALAFALLCGRAPYEGSLYEVLDQVVSRRPSWTRGVPRALRSVVERAMEKEPQRRYASAQAFERALAEWPAAGQRAPLALALGAALLAVAALGALAFARSGPRVSATPARTPAQTPVQSTLTPPPTTAPRSPLELPPPASLDRALDQALARLPGPGLVGARHLPDGRLLAWALGAPGKREASVFELQGDLSGQRVQARPGAVSSRP